MPFGSLTTLFAHATAWVMSSVSKAEKEVVRNENDFHRNFMLSLGLVSFILLGGWQNIKIIFQESIYLCMLGGEFFFIPSDLAWNKTFCFSFTKVMGNSGIVN